MIVTIPKMIITDGISHLEYEGIDIPVSQDGDWLVFDPTDWAPGIWAGCEGFKILLDGKPMIVTAVDFQNRRIQIIDIMQELYNEAEKLGLLDD